MRNVMIGLIVAGAIALIGGLFVGIGEVTTSANGRSISCGSAWSPNYSAADREASVDRLASAMSGGKLTGDEGRRASCAAAYGSRSGLGIMFVLIAAVAGIAAVMVHVQQKSAAVDEPVGKVGDELA